MDMRVSANTIKGNYVACARQPAVGHTPKRQPGCSPLSAYCALLCRLLYVLLFLQFSCNTFYDPARRALVPTVVPAEQLPLATTLDSFAWSLMGAFGASLGGLAVSAAPWPRWDILSHQPATTYLAGLHGLAQPAGVWCRALSLGCA